MFLAASCQSGLLALKAELQQSEERVKGSQSEKYGFGGLRRLLGSAALQAAAAAQDCARIWGGNAAGGRCSQVLPIMRGAGCEHEVRWNGQDRCAKAPKLMLGRRVVVAKVCVRAQ